MTKLSYVNRKSEGVKLGQIVAKDVRKRAKTSSPSAHKDTSPIELLLDNKNLTDEGFAEAARGLEEALHQSYIAGRGTLSVLSLAGNGLTCRSLFELAQTVRLSCHELLELDLSNNHIDVASPEDAHNLAVFLDALGQCSALQVLNLSRNDLGGSSAWEVFAKAYSDQWANNSAALEQLADDVDDVGNDMLKVVASTRALSVTVQDGTAASSGLTDLQPQRLRGLPAVCTMMIENANLTDSGALWLSFCSGRHAWIQDRLRARQGGDAVRQGFRWSPNENLSNVGQKVLKQVTEARHSPVDALPPVPENSPMSRHTSVDCGGSRRVSSASHQHTPQHRRISSSSSSPDTDRSFATLENLESTRRKLQRTIIEEKGAQSVELWRVALKTLTFVRTLLSGQQRPIETPTSCDWPASSSPERDNDRTPHTPSPVRQPQTYASKLVIDNARNTGPALSITGASTTPITPQIFRHPRARHENVSVHSNSSSPQSSVNSQARAAILKAAVHMTDATDEVINGLPESAWMKILRQHCDPNDVLSDKHMRGIFAWGREKGTLAAEIGQLGKPESVQIWRVLEGMRCLSYSD